jgi:RNA polymerase sigma-70 factor (ECF subfamily)
MRQLIAGRRGTTDAALLQRAQNGDEDAFMQLVERHHTTMLRVARALLRNDALAEEAAQDTWLAVVRGIDRFEGRSQFRTWLLAILVNRARSAGAIERRSLAIGDAATVESSRFDAAGAWITPPVPWTEAVEERLAADAIAPALRAALDGLPAQQRDVVMLRDVDGLTGSEVCAALDISEANQRVLLHRGRSSLRRSLEEELR